MGGRGWMEGSSLDTGLSNPPCPLNLQSFVLLGGAQFLQDCPQNPWPDSCRFPRLQGRAQTPGTHSASTWRLCPEVQPAPLAPLPGQLPCQAQPHPGLVVGVGSGWGK